MVELQSRRFVVTRVVVRIASVGLLAVSCTSAPSSTAAANAVVPAATALVTAEPTPAEATPTPTAAVTAIPVATATPDPTATPGPTATPAPAVEAECVRLTEFATDVDAALWRVVNDGVMGGLSQGVATFADSTMRFAGEINTNGGGFSSVRVGLLPGALDGANRIVVRARTDGRIYKLTFDDALAGRDQRISHQADLRYTAGDDWQIGVLSFDDLTASLFGRAVQTEPFRPDLAIEMGVILSDGIDGPFQIDLDWIDACK